MTTDCDSFDDVIVGSSPLMLMQAICTARQGHKVAVVDRTDDLGGAWQTARLPTGEDVEIACHLIEVFPGVYDVLERLSGTRFVTLDAPPIRITRGGAVAPYFSRTLMVASGVRLLVGWFKTQFNAVVGRPDRNAMLNFDTKLKSFLRYQLPTFFQTLEMKGPENGFVEFMQGLSNRARHDGVAILQFDVRTLAKDCNERWHLNDGHRTIAANRVHLTTSTNLRKVANGRFEATQPVYSNRSALVVDIPREGVGTSQSYVAFWKDPMVARISRIDFPGAAQKPLRFLVEFHESGADRLDDLEDVVTNRLRKARILKDGARHDIVGRVECRHTTNVHQLPSGQIDDGVWGYYSYGNLAAGVAAWEKHTSSFPDLIETATKAEQ